MKCDIQKMKIFLIGYRGTGKSSVGKKLAKILGFKFIDTDFYIQNKQKQTISSIVHKNGWNFFRNLEKKILNEVVQAENNFIISTGGGIIENSLNVEIMKKNGAIIWLKANPDTIFERISKDKDSDHLRPALSSSSVYDEIKEVLARRIPIYEKASDYFVDTDNLKIDDVVKNINSNFLQKV